MSLGRTLRSLLPADHLQHTHLSFLIKDWKEKTTLKHLWDKSSSNISRGVLFLMHGLMHDICSQSPVNAKLPCLPADLWELCPVTPWRRSSLTCMLMAARCVTSAQNAPNSWLTSFPPAAGAWTSYTTLPRKRPKLLLLLPLRGHSCSVSPTSRLFPNQTPNFLHNPNDSSSTHPEDSCSDPHMVHPPPNQVFQDLQRARHSCRPEQSAWVNKT